MEISKETVVSVKTTDGQKIVNGDICLMQFGECSMVGEYTGLTKYGALGFKSVVAGCNETFNIKPRSISKIYKVNIVPVKAVDECKAK